MSTIPCASTTPKGADVLRFPLERTRRFRLSPLANPVAHRLRDVGYLLELQLAGVTDARVRETRFAAAMAVTMLARRIEDHRDRDIGDLAALVERCVDIVLEIGAPS